MNTATVKTYKALKTESESPKRTSREDTAFPRTETFLPYATGHIKKEMQFTFTFVFVE